jgi:hypothetical protein
MKSRISFIVIIQYMRRIIFLIVLFGKSTNLLVILLRKDVPDKHERIFQNDCCFEYDENLRIRLLL